MAISDTIKDYALSKGCSLVGFADLSGVAEADLPYGISIAVALDAAVLRGIADGPTWEFREEYDRVNQVLFETVEGIAAILEEKGCKTDFWKPTAERVDQSILTSPVPHKTVATHAGLGWIGKTALLVTPEYGSAVRICSVLTDCELPVSNPESFSSRCGRCSMCVEACPANAATGEHWEPQKHRDEFFNAAACRDKAREIGFEKLGIHSAFCSKCVYVCPFTRKYLRR